MKGIKVFKGEDEFALTRLMNDWMERAGVEAINVSGFADRHNYLYVIVTYQSTDNNVGGTIPNEPIEHVVEDINNTRRFIGSNMCFRHMIPMVAGVGCPECQKDRKFAP